TICSTPRRRGRRICWTGRSCGWVSCRCELSGARLIAGGKGELHGLRSSDLLGGIEKLNGHEPHGFVVIQDQSGSRLIALRHFAWAKNDRQGIRLFVVDDLHGVLSIWRPCWSCTRLPHGMPSLPASPPREAAFGLRDIRL